MLEHRKLDQLAHLSVARGSGFAALAIATVIFGLSGHMATAFKIGGVLMLLCCLVLLLKAAYASRRRYRDTELWVLLEPEDRPAKAIAQRIIATVMRQKYLTFAHYFALGAVALLAGSLLLSTFKEPLRRGPADAGITLNQSEVSAEQARTSRQSR